MAVTDSQVKAIIDTARDTAPFIATAQLIADEDLAGTILSDSRKDQIVLYLAAHFVCITEESGGLRRSKLGDADESYRVPGDKELGLAYTRYGQQAMILDTTGTLASLSAKSKLSARFELVGANPAFDPQQ